MSAHPVTKAGFSVAKEQVQNLGNFSSLRGGSPRKRRAAQALAAPAPRSPVPLLFWAGVYSVSTPCATEPCPGTAGVFILEENGTATLNGTSLQNFEYSPVDCWISFQNSGTYGEFFFEAFDDFQKATRPATTLRGFLKSPFGSLQELEGGVQNMELRRWMGNYSRVTGSAPADFRFSIDSLGRVSFDLFPIFPKFHPSQIEVIGGTG